MARDRYGYGNEYEDSGLWDRNFLTRSISSIVPQMGITAGQMGIAYGITSGVGGMDPRRPEYASIVEQLKSTAPKGTRFTNVDLSKGSPTDFLNPMKQAHFDPRTNTINTGQRGSMPDPGLMSHELGHQKQFSGSKATPKLNKYAQSSRIANMFGLTTMPLMIADKESTAKIWTGIGTAMATPNFIHEMDASMKGRKLLMDAASKSGNKLGFLKSLGSFKGIPSYLLALASPYLIYKWLKSRDQYEQG